MLDIELVFFLLHTNKSIQTLLLCFAFLFMITSSLLIFNLIFISLPAFEPFSLTKPN